MPHLLVAIVVMLLIGTFTVSPADAKGAPALPGNCTFKNGRTTCVEQTTTVAPGPLANTSCTIDGLKGAYTQEQATTVTTTTVYRGRRTSGEPLSSATTTSTEVGEAVCTPFAGQVSIDPDPSCTGCYTVAGSGLLPGSIVEYEYEVDADRDPSTPPEVIHSFTERASDDGTYTNSIQFDCGVTLTERLEVIATDVTGRDVTAFVYPC